jgi:hypothetical protein
VEETVAVVKAAGAPIRQRSLAGLGNAGFYDDVGVPYYAEDPALMPISASGRRGWRANNRARTS